VLFNWWRRRQRRVWGTSLSSEDQHRHEPPLAFLLPPVRSPTRLRFCQQCLFIRLRGRKWRRGSFQRSPGSATELPSAGLDPARRLRVDGEHGQAGPVDHHPAVVLVRPQLSTGAHRSASLPAADRRHTALPQAARRPPSTRSGLTLVALKVYLTMNSRTRYPHKNIFAFSPYSHNI